MPGASIAALQHPAILRANARQHYWEGIGTLSIKLFRNGRAFYQSGSARYAVEDDRYLILNDGQPYSITVQANMPVESFCIFFPTGFAEAVQHSLTTPTNQLLDDPTTPDNRIHFVDRTYPYDDLLTPAVRRLQAGSGALSSGWVDEQLHTIMLHMLGVHQQVYTHIAHLPAVRAATRDELYRRLHHARDYILACYDTPIQLADMAAVSHLSVNHFLRSFKQLFGQTPHQFLTAVRLQESSKRLLTTEEPVTDICLQVGFESPSSFSYLFRRYMGLSPDQYRRQKR